MDIVIRQANASDAAAWLNLLKRAMGEDYSDREIYDLKWVTAELGSRQETWLVEVEGEVRGSISILAPFVPNNNPIANVGRHLALRENYRDGVAESLLRRVSELCAQRGQMAILRVPASDLEQQTLVEALGYVCAGFQPFKHLCGSREGMLFYLRVVPPDLVRRLPHSMSLPQINELAGAVLNNVRIPNPEMVRDGATGYPLQTGLKIEESTVAAYELSKARAQSAHPPAEISGQFNRGVGMFRVARDTPMHVLLGQREGQVVAGLSYYLDDHDGCLRLVDSFATDDLSTGAMMQRAVKLAQERFNAAYVEVDLLMTAPRILKSAEQLGFVPVAYLPGFFARDGGCADLVKMVKLNMAYARENITLTAHARAIANLIDRNFEDQKVGLAIINLLRTLPVFEGLGDGELCKMARLFTQKLYRANERVFDKGPSGNEAYVVMRGQVDVILEENARPIASFGNGTILGEQAFLDGAPRNALGVAAQPSILLVIQRAAFNELVQTEPHLGMVVMRNIALDLSNKLRKASTALSSAKK